MGESWPRSPVQTECRRSSSLAGMFTIALDSFSDSQNFVHAFKSLLVLYWVFLDFCACKSFSISTSSSLVASSAELKFANVCSFSLLASFLAIYWFFHLVLLTGTSQFVRIFLIVTFWGQMLEQHRSRCRSRCRSRWENLDRGQYRF